MSDRAANLAYLVPDTQKKNVCSHTVASIAVEVARSLVAPLIGRSGSLAHQGRTRPC